MQKGYKYPVLQLNELVDAVHLLDNALHNIHKEKYFFFITIFNVLRGILTDKPKGGQALLLRLAKMIGDPLEIYYYKAGPHRISGVEDSYLFSVELALQKRIPMHEKRSLPDILEENIYKHGKIKRSLRDIINIYSNTFGGSHFPDRIEMDLAEIYALEKTILSDPKAHHFFPKNPGRLEIQNTIIAPIHRLAGQLAEVCGGLSIKIVRAMCEFDLSFFIILSEDIKNTVILRQEGAALGGFLQVGLNNNCIKLNGVASGRSFEVVSKRNLKPGNIYLVTLSHRITDKLYSEFEILVNGRIYKKSRMDYRLCMNVPVESKITLGTLEAPENIQIQYINTVIKNFDKYRKMHLEQLVEVRKESSVKSIPLGGQRLYPQFAKNHPAIYYSLKPRSILPL